MGDSSGGVICGPAPGAGPGLSTGSRPQHLPVSLTQSSHKSLGGEKHVKGTTETPRSFPGSAFKEESVGESIPTTRTAPQSSRTSNPQHPAWPRENFDPQLPATSALSLFPQLGTGSKGKTPLGTEGRISAPRGRDLQPALLPRARLRMELRKSSVIY